MRSVRAPHRCARTSTHLCRRRDCCALRTQSAQVRLEPSWPHQEGEPVGSLEESRKRWGRRPCSGPAKFLPEAAAWAEFGKSRWTSTEAQISAQSAWVRPNSGRFRQFCTMLQNWPNSGQFRSECGRNKAKSAAHWPEFGQIGQHRLEVGPIPPKLGRNRADLTESCSITVEIEPSTAVGVRPGSAHSAELNSGPLAGARSWAESSRKSWRLSRTGWLCLGLYRMPMSGVVNCGPESGLLWKPAFQGDLQRARGSSRRSVEECPKGPILHFRSRLRAAATGDLSGAIEHMSPAAANTFAGTPRLKF